MGEQTTWQRTASSVARNVLSAAEWDTLGGCATQVQAVQAVRTLLSDTACSISSVSWKVQLLVEGSPVSIEVDTRSAVTLMSESNFSEKLPGVKREETLVKLTTYTGHSVPIKGVANVGEECNPAELTLPLLAVEGGREQLLSLLG